MRLSRNRIEKLLRPAGAPPAVHLQGIGSVLAKPAREFGVGDYAAWNYGYASEILSVTPKGQTQLTWIVRSEDGREWTRVVKADRLVAIGHAPRISRS